jgi:biopolymer transport protein ExbD
MTKVKKPPQKEEDNKLLLTAIITDSVVTLGAKGGFLPSVFYQEYHRYVDKENKAIDFTVKFDPKATEPPKHPQTGRAMEIYERYDIYLYACPDDYSEVIKALYNSQSGKLCTDAESVPIKEMVNVGDTIYELTNPRKLVVVQDPAEYVIKELSVYDELQNKLMKVKERFKDAEDADDIIIAAENQVMYDKIIQIMDAARQADFPNISIAKLRSF